MSVAWEGKIARPWLKRGHTPGPSHPNWRGGKTRGEKGHARLSAGPDRGQYEHRVIVRELLREWNCYGWKEIPPGFQVHHLDFKEAHNCTSNLLLLDHRIHQAFIKDYRYRLASGWFAPQSEAPDWVTGGFSDEIGAFE